MIDESQRDPLTFEDIYEMFGERVLNLAYRMTGNEDVARDLAQEVFVKVYQNLHTFEHRSHILTWLLRITTNHVLNYLKKERRRHWVDLFDEKISDAIRSQDVDPRFPRNQDIPPDRKLENKQRAELVWSIVQNLPDAQRVPFVMFHYEGMEQKQIAEAMGLSVPAVETRIHRARQALIKALEKWLDRI